MPCCWVRRRRCESRLHRVSCSRQFERQLGTFLPRLASVYLRVTARRGGPMARILLADADAFFVGVARLADPNGAGRAPLLIVGGARDSRGVVCSASYETRKFGVRSAMPIARALRLCPDAMCVPVPFKECIRQSAEIRKALQQYTPVVEGASIDEWYLDLTGTEGVYHHEPLETTAQRIRTALREATGLTLSIGGGTNKLIAKMAVDLVKTSRRRPGSALIPHATP